MSVSRVLAGLAKAYVPITTSKIGDVCVTLFSKHQETDEVEVVLVQFLEENGEVAGVQLSLKELRDMIKASTSALNSLEGVL